MLWRAIPPQPPAFLPSPPTNRDPRLPPLQPRDFLAWVGVQHQPVIHLHQLAANLNGIGHVGQHRLVDGRVLAAAQQDVVGFACGVGEAQQGGNAACDAANQVMQPSMILPSPKGPFWWRQRLLTAESLSPCLKMAMFSPSVRMVWAQRSSMSAHAQT